MDKHINILKQLFGYFYNKNIGRLNNTPFEKQHNDIQHRYVITWIYDYLKDG